MSTAENCYGKHSMSGVELTDQQTENLRMAYRELCTSYRAIDDFRTKLLGFLPLATGTGIFLLVTDEAKMRFVQEYSWTIGVFGFFITLGLFLFELYGIKKCTALICAGRQLEDVLLKIRNGQFEKRPLGVLGIINEPLAAGIIYPAVLAAWTFLALDFSQFQNATNIIKWMSQHAAQLAVIVFAVGFIIGLSASIFYTFYFEKGTLGCLKK